MAAKDTASKTWLIESAEEFKAFRDEVNSGTTFEEEGWTVSLGADIDLAGEENFGTIGIDEDLSFRGTFDGNGKTISNLKITSTENNVGLFGYIAGATIRNFTLENADVTGEKCTAAVVGNANSGTIENVTVQGVVNVSGTDSVGAVAGQGYVILTHITVDVSNDSFVKGTERYVGGVMGNCFPGEKTMSDITSDINVIGESFDIVAVGGIFGHVGENNTLENITCNAAYIEGKEIKIQDIANLNGLWGDKADSNVSESNCTDNLGEIRYSYYAGNDPETPLIYHGAYQVRNNRDVTLGNTVFSASNVIVGTARGMEYGGDSSAAAEGETGKLTLGAGSEITAENVWVGGDQTGEGKASAGADRNFHLIVDGGKLTSTDEIINVRFDGDMEVKNGGTVDTNCLKVNTSLDVTGEGTEVTVENTLTLEGGETEETAAVLNIADGAVVNVPGWAQEAWHGNLDIGNDTEYAAVNVSGAVLQAKNVNIEAKGKVTLNNGTLEATAAVNNGEFYAAGSKIEADSISGSGTFTIGSGNSELQIGNLQQDIRVNENTDKAVALTGNVGTGSTIRVYGEAVLNDFSVNGDYEGQTVSATGQVLVYGDTVISGDSKMALNYFQSTASVTIESGVSIRTANINIYDMEADSDFVLAGSMEAATLIIYNNYYNVASGSEMIVAEGGMLNGTTQNGNGRFDIQTGCMTVYGYVNSTWSSGGGTAYIGNSGYDAILTVDGTYASDDSNNGKFINNGTQNLIIGVAGWLKLVNGAEFTWTADITNNNWITMDAASTLTAGTLTGSGIITIDAEGFTGTRAVIDLNGDTSLEGKVEFENRSDDIRVIYGNDGDVILTDADTTTLYANTGWAGTKVGTDLGNGRIYGGNAFDSFVQALDEKTANTTSFVVYSDFTEALSGKTLTGNIINGGENAVKIADSENNGYVNMTGVTLGKNITIDAKYFYLDGNNEINGRVTSSTTFYSSGKLTLNGTAEVYTVMSRYYTSLEDGIYIVGTAEAGKGAEADVQLKAVNYLGHYSGTFSVKDTAVEFGYILLNGDTDGDGYSQAQLVLDNAKVATIGGPNTQPGQVLMNGDSAIIATNKSVLDFRGPKDFGYILMEENNSISLNDSTLLLGKEGQGTNTLNGEVTLENNASLETIGGITNKGTLSASGSTVNIGSGVTNSGTIAVTDSTFTAGGTVSNTGTFTVAGESTLDIAAVTGNAIVAEAGTTLVDSKVGGAVKAANGEFTFKGNNTITKLRVTDDDDAVDTVINVNDGTLTVNNPGFTGDMTFNGNGNIALLGGTFFQNGDFTFNTDVAVNGGALYFTSANVEINSDISQQATNGEIIYINGSDVTVNEGASLTGFIGIYGANGALRVNGGTVTASGMYQQAALILNGGTVDVSGTVSNTGSVEMNGGKLTVGTFDNSTGSVTVAGESTLNIGSFNGGKLVWDKDTGAHTIKLLDGAVITDSTVRGYVDVVGKVTFKGDNTFATIQDFEVDYLINNDAVNSTEMIVEAGASVTLNGGKLGIGYGDKITVNGTLEDAKAAYEDRTLSEDDFALDAQQGVYLKASRGGDVSTFDINNAYVRLGNKDYHFMNDKNTTDGTLNGTYNFNWDNAVVTAEGAFRILDSGNLDGQYNFTLNNSVFTIGDIYPDANQPDVYTHHAGFFQFSDKDSTFTATGSKVVSIGTDSDQINAGTLNFTDSVLEFNSTFINEAGAVAAFDGEDALLDAPVVVNNGKIDLTGGASMTVDYYLSTLLDISYDDGNKFPEMFTIVAKDEAGNEIGRTRISTNGGVNDLVASFTGVSYEFLDENGENAFRTSVTVNSASTTDSGEIVLDETSKLIANRGFENTGTITIDVTDGWTGALVLIDAADGTSEAQFGNIVIDADDAAAGVDYSIDKTNGNLVIHNVNTETVYFNTDWAGKALSEKVGNGIHYGFNAFDKFTDNGTDAEKGWSNLMVLPEDTTEIVLAAGNGDDASYGMLRPTQSITVKTAGDGYAVIDRFVNVIGNLTFAADSKVKVLCDKGSSGANNQGDGTGAQSQITINGEVYLANANSSYKALYLWGMNETPGKLVINAGGILKADCGNVENHGTISVYGKMELGSAGSAPKLAGVGEDGTGWHGHLNVDGKDGEGILTVNHNRINFGGGNTSSPWMEPAGDTACTVTISNGGKITTEAVYFRNGAKSIMTIDNGTLEFVTSGSYNYSWDMAAENLRYFDNQGIINVSGNGKVDMSGRNFTNAGTFTLTKAEMTVDKLTNSGTFTLAGETTLNTTGAVGAVSLQEGLVLDGDMVLDTVNVDGAAEVVGKMSAANVDVFDNDLTVSGGGSVSGNEISLKSIVTLIGLQPVDENRTLAISFVPVDQNDEGTTLDIDIPAGSKEVRVEVAGLKDGEYTVTIVDNPENIYKIGVTVRQGGLVLENGDINAGVLNIGYGSVKMDALSTITAESIILSDEKGKGSIDIAVKDFIEEIPLYQKLIDITGDGELNIDCITIDGEAFTGEYVNGGVTVINYDNDLYLIDAIRDSLYVDTEYAGKQLFSLVNDKVVGFNAFADMTELKKVLTDNCTDIIFTAGNADSYGDLKVDQDMTLGANGTEVVTLGSFDAADDSADNTVTIAAGASFAFTGDSVVNSGDAIAVNEGASLKFGNVSNAGNIDVTSAVLSAAELNNTGIVNVTGNSSVQIDKLSGTINADDAALTGYVSGGTLNVTGESTIGAGFMAGKFAFGTLTETVDANIDLTGLATAGFAVQNGTVDITGKMDASGSGLAQFLVSGNYKTADGSIKEGDLNAGRSIVNVGSETNTDVYVKAHQVYISETGAVNKHTLNVYGELEATKSIFNKYNGELNVYGKAAADYLQVAGNVTVTGVGAALTLVGTGSNGAAKVGLDDGSSKFTISNGATLDADGVVWVGHNSDRNGEMIVDNATVDASAGITVAADSTFTIKGTSTVKAAVTGNISLNGDVTFSDDTAITITGDVTADGDVSMKHNAITGASSFTVKGTLSLRGVDLPDADKSITLVDCKASFGGLSINEYTVIDNAFFVNGNVYTVAYGDDEVTLDSVAYTQMSGTISTVAQQKGTYKFTVTPEIAGGFGGYTYTTSAYDVDGKEIAKANGLTVIISEAELTKLSNSKLTFQVTATDKLGMNHTTGKVEAVLRDYHDARRDFNANGVSDIAVFDEENRTFSVIADQGNGTFRKYQIDDKVGDTSWKCLGTGYMNSGKTQDVLWVHDSGEVGVWLVNDSSKTHQTVAGATSDWKFLAIADVTGDGRDNIIWQHETGTVLAWESGANAVLSGNKVLGGVDIAEWNFAGTGDVTGDGAHDILWRHTDGLVGFWNSSDGSWVSLGSADEHWQILETGDFDNDGIDEILWQNDSGLVGSWDYDNGKVTWNSFGDANTLAGYDFSAVGDYNGDGFEDILWCGDGTDNYKVWSIANNEKKESVDIKLA